MQRILKVALFCAAALLSVVACTTPNQSAPPADAGSVTVAEEFIAEEAEASAEEVVAADSEPTAVAIVPALTGPTDDFTLIGMTGRPQFLNSYANW